MIARMTINLDPAERQALGDLARREYRDPRAQAVLLIRRSLEELGYLAPASAETNEQREAKRAERA